MREYLTEAIVLTISPAADTDRLIDFYTKDFGRLKAKAVSGAKILSKLAAHLNPLNLVQVRLIEKNQLIVADAVVKNSFAGLRNNQIKLTAAISLINLLRSLLFSADRDLQLWYWLKRTLETGHINYRQFFKLLGYDLTFAQCQICRQKPVTSFSVRDQSFLCYRCRSKFPPDDLIYIK